MREKWAGADGRTASDVLASLRATDWLESA